MISGVSGSKSLPMTKEADKYQTARAKGELLIQKGMTLSKLASQFNMSIAEFKKYTGLKSSNIQVGQTLKGLPSVTLPKSKGLAYLARENGMSLTDFCKLNGISQNYKADPGEKFFVKKQEDKKPASQPAKPAEPAEPTKAPEPPKPVTPPPAPKSDTTKNEEASAAKDVENQEPTENEKLAASLKTADDIAKALKKSAKMTAAVGKDKFNIPFNKIDKNNVIDVIQKYDEISPGESLIEMISDEWGSSKESRMKSITTLYDTLAKAVGSKVATPEKREAFMAELEDQYSSWGTVSTDKMDKMINELISPPKAEYRPKYDKDGIEVATASQRSVASNGKKPEIPRGEDGSIIAEVIRFVPEYKDKNGPLKGKTIMINAGHGWGTNSKGEVFKPGTNAKDSNGKIIHEWYKNRNFADQLIKKLTAQGATVIYTAGDAQQVCDAKRELEADMMISLHCNAAGNKKVNGLEVFYPEGSAIGKEFAQVTERHLDKLVSFGKQGGANDHCKTKSDKETQHKSIGLLQIDKENTPSILIEMGYQSNPKDLKNIDSAQFRSDSMDRVTDAVIEYLRDKE